ncbi:MAG: YqhA family protein [Streptosporangiaceae bacterium]
MTEPKPANGGDGQDAGRPGSPAGRRLRRDFERGLSLAQLTVLLPVIALLLSGVGAYVYGTVYAIHSVADIADQPFAAHNLRLFLTEIDLFLIGATLVIAAVGLYELFVARIDPVHTRRPLPAWLEMNDLDDLKVRVISMIVLVSAVTFTDELLEFGDDLKALYLAAGVGVFIIALTIYLRFGSHNGGDHA